MTRPEVTAVLVSYNSAVDLAEVLPALDDPRVEVLVVDNASVDASREVAGGFSHVTVLPLSTNTGWTAACNAGARAATGGCVAFVNPDARPTAAQLVALSLRLTDGVGSVSPRFLESDGTTSSFYFRFPRPLAGLLTFTSAGRRVDVALGGRAMAARLYDHDPEAADQVDQPGAACLLVDRVAFLAEGGFDESMWLFFSDAAWCRAQARRGRQHLVAWDIAVPHLGGTSVTTLSETTVQRLFQRDYFAYSRREYGPLGRTTTVVGLLVLAVLVPMVSAALRGRVALVRQRAVLVRDLVGVARGARPGPLS